MGGGCPGVGTGGRAGRGAGRGTSVQKACLSSSSFALGLALFTVWPEGSSGISSRWGRFCVFEAH